MVVMATTLVWYPVDAYYNDYNLYQQEIGNIHLNNAWIQVILFIVTIGGLCPKIAGLFSSRVPNDNSVVMQYLETLDSSNPHFQGNIDKVAGVLFKFYIALALVGLFRTGFDFGGNFFPWFVGYKVDPWGRERIGGGISFLISLASYFNIFVTGGLGLVLAISTNKKTRSIAFILSIMAFPYFIFDRTRNTILATVLPGFLSWVLIRLKTNILIKGGILVLGFLLMDSWFSFVLAQRTDKSIAGAFKQGLYFNSSENEEPKSNPYVSDEEDEDEEAKHLGLNMLEELGWINKFIAEGTYQPNWGARYFAEAVNPIPRAIWKNKPMIGIDYAIARGQKGGSEAGAGVFATISTGMIGQGVVNFSVFIGPIFAGILMCVWIGLLTRLDLMGQNPGRLLLYGCGIILTFNLGRDITLITLYPFIFGALALKFWERTSKHDFDKQQPDANIHSKNKGKKSRKWTQNFR